MSAPAPSPEDRALLERAAALIARHRMAVPAMMALETLAPVNVVGCSALRVLSPILSIGLPRARLDDLARLLERRETIPAFIRMIDEADERRRREERDEAPPPPDSRPRRPRSAREPSP